MNIALVLAGGIGSRMGQDIPKQFIHVNNCPIIIYTLLALQNHSKIDLIHVVCVDGWESILAGYAKQFNITKLQRIVHGGSNRYESTRKGFISLGDVKDDDIIIVHDSVRPLITAELLSDTIDVCRKKGNSMSVIDCIDTMYVRSGVGYTSEGLNRDAIVRGQTPEAVTGARMREMYDLADEKNLQNDSISALQSMLGWRIHFSKGDERNIKLTSKADIELFKALLTTESESWLK